MALRTHWKLPWSTYEERCADTAFHGPLRVKLATVLAPILDKIELPWFIDSGTLLGAWRDNGKMIPHDDDFDTGFYMSRKEVEAKSGSMANFAEGLCKDIQASLPAPYRARPVSSYCVKVEVFDPSYGKYNLSEDHDFHNVTVDVSLYTDRLDDASLVTSTHRAFQFMAFKKEVIFPIGKIAYEGHEFPAPHDTEAFLKELYGYLGRDAVYCTETGKYVKKGSEKVPNFLVKHHKL